METWGGVWEQKGVSVDVLETRGPLGFAETSKSNANSDGPGQQVPVKYLAPSQRAPKPRARRCGSRGTGESGYPEGTQPRSSDSSGPRQDARG